MGDAAQNTGRPGSSNIRLLSIVVIFVFLAIVLISVVGTADDSDAGTEFKVDGINYETTSESEVKVTVGSYTGTVAIPASVDNGGKTYSVISIDDYALSDCTSLTSVTIPNTVTSIGQYAFYQCTSLASVIIPDSVKSIGDSAFRNCTSMTSVTIGKGVTQISSKAFCMCTGMTSLVFKAENCTQLSDNGDIFKSAGTVGVGIDVEITDDVKKIPPYLFASVNPFPKIISVSLGNNVETIGMWAFYGLSLIQSISIPDSVKTIDHMAFYDCTSMTSVTIGKGVTSMGNRVFAECTNLTSIVYKAENCGNIGSTDRVFNNSGTASSGIDVLFSDDVTRIPDYLFYSTEVTPNVISVTMGSNMGAIGDHSFQGCSCIDDMTIPEKVTSIGQYAFFGCCSMDTMIFMGDMTTIGDDAFCLGYDDSHRVSCEIIGCKERLLDPYKNEFTTFTYRFFVTYDVNGGTGSFAPEIVGREYILKEYDGIKEGYRYKGWSNGITTYQPGAEVIIDDDVTFIAVWSDKVIVSYDVNGGTGSVPADEAKGQYILKGYDGTKDGYSFKGWSCGSEQYEVGDTVDIVNDTTFTAVWEKNGEPSSGGSKVGIITVIIAVIVIIVTIIIFAVLNAKGRL